MRGATRYIAILLVTVGLLTGAAYVHSQICEAGVYCVLSNVTEKNCTISADCQEPGGGYCGYGYVYASVEGCQGNQCYLGSGYDIDCGGYVWAEMSSGGVVVCYSVQYCCC